MLYAMDKDWWDKHIKEVRRAFRGELTTTSNRCQQHGLNMLRVKDRPMPTFGNSGAGAVAVATFAGASRIIMLGYDLQKKEGLSHWHGDHPAGLGNAGSIHRWPVQFANLAKTTANIYVVNASRETALTVFPRKPLEEVLCS